MLETRTRGLTLVTLGAALMFTLSAGPAIPGIASPTGQNSRNSAKAEVPVYSTSPPTSARVLGTRTTSNWAASVEHRKQVGRRRGVREELRIRGVRPHRLDRQRLPLHARNQLGHLTRRHPARDQLRAVPGRPGAGHVLDHPGHPRAAHGADHVGQPFAEPRPAFVLALLELERCRQRRPLQPGAHLPRDQLCGRGRAVPHRRRVEQPRGRAPAVAAEPVQHHDGLGLDQHRERHHGDRTHLEHPRPTRRTSPGRPPATSRAPWSPAVAGRCRPATGR